MLKQKVCLEVKIGERIYSMDIPLDSPLGEVHDALFQMRSYIVKRINDASEADKTKPVEEQPKSE